MAEGNGGGEGIIIPIGLEDNVTPELRRIVQNAASLMREVSDAATSRGVSRVSELQGVAGTAAPMVSEPGGAYEPPNFSEMTDKMAASVEKAMESIAGAWEKQLASLQSRMDAMMSSPRDFLGMTEAQYQARAMASGLRRGNDDVMASQGAAYASSTLERGGVRAIGGAAILSDEGTRGEQLGNTMQNERNKLQADIDAAYARLAQVVDADADIETSNLRLAAERKVLLTATNAAQRKEEAAILAQLAGDESFTIPGMSPTQKETFIRGLSPMGVRRGMRRHLGNIGEAFIKGMHGEGEEDETGTKLNPEGHTGIRGGLANIGGLGGIGGAMVAPMTGYAGFMLGMYALNDVTRFMMSMEQEARKLEDALAPLSQTFQNLGYSTAAYHGAVNQVFGASFASGVAPSQLAPVAGFAAAQYGAGAVPGALRASYQYAQVTGSNPTEAYSTLRGIGTPFGVNNLSQVSDVLVSTSQKFGIAIQDVAQGLQQVSLVAANSGITMKQSAVIIGKSVQDSGLSAATEGGAFARILTVLQGNIGTLVNLGQMIPSLGKTLTPDVLASGDPGKLLQAVGGAHLTDAQQILLSQELGIGRQDVAAQGVIKAVTQTNAGTTGLGATSGSAGNLFNAEMSTFDGQLKIAGNDLRNFGTQIVSDVLPALTEFVKVLNIGLSIPGAIGKAANSPGVSKTDWFGQNEWHAITNAFKHPMGSLFSGWSDDPATTPDVNGPGSANFIKSRNGLVTQARAGTFLPLTSSRLQSLGADTPTISSLYNSGWFGAGMSGQAGYASSLQGQESTIVASLRSGNLSPQALQELAPKLEQVRSALTQLYTQQASEATTQAALIAAQRDGNNIQASLRDQMVGAQNAITALTQAYQQDPTLQNLQALQSAQQSQASINNQLAAAQASAQQSQLQGMGAVGQARLLGQPVEQSKLGIANLQAQVSQLQTQAQNGAIDPAQAQAQIYQLQAQIISQQYQLAETQFQQSQASLVGVQGLAQSRGQVVEVAKDQLQLDTQKLAFLKQHSPGDELAIAQQQNQVLQDIVGVAQARAQVESGILGVVAAQQKAHGQIVAADQTTLTSLTQQLATLEAAGLSPNSPQATSLQQQIIQQTAQVNQDFVSTQESHIQAMADIHQITTGQELGLLQLLLNSPQARSLGQPVLDQIRQQIQGVYNQLSNNLQFDLPSNINVAGLYYSAKRGVGVGGTGAYNDNRVVTVNITAGNAAQMAQVQQIINDTLGQSNQVFGPSTRRY